MKRLRLERWSGQVLSTRTRLCCLRQWQHEQTPGNRRLQSNATSIDLIREDAIDNKVKFFKAPWGAGSPPPEAALQSSKLAALHARLSLPKKLPLQTMARTLVDPSADSNPNINNAQLAQVGGVLVSYYVSEWLVCTYPRLPMRILFAATYAFNGPPTLCKIAQEWGVESVAYPGPEVDPGLLQFTKLVPGSFDPAAGPPGGSVRPDLRPFFRRGISSRNVYDDEFGDLIGKQDVSDLPQTTDNAYANFVKAVVGSIYIHAGRTAAKNFIKAHILSRHLDISSLFNLDQPIMELKLLCNREAFELPVARILSETGRHSISPVFVVGIFSGTEKLGEGSGPSLSEARTRASVAALKAWYLYSPGNKTRVPSETEDQNSKPWEPVHIDMGEIVA